ncbi:P-loop containing nucleoside triphosphate hydrolase protein [Rhexocercosporidium sp. MPI-PUGE-AT-0058]|nr:P-loop containing nucleoside triphosphate hydrolase protein [Rhexocercosporidium sp. MPI-PUGE-AT-0058]
MSKHQNPSKWTIIFVLGGPGAGKGTQCSRLAANYPIAHLSMGDILREEQEKPGSIWDELIRKNILEGVIGPPEMAVSLLQESMAEKHKKGGISVFLLDGFPRRIEHVARFESTIGSPSAVLFLDCPEDVLQERLLTRGKTSGRVDDNIAVIHKRFKTFAETTMPVVEHFRKQDRVVQIDATKDADAVHRDIQIMVEEKLGDVWGRGKK